MFFGATVSAFVWKCINGVVAIGKEGVFLAVFTQCMQGNVG